MNFVSIALSDDRTHRLDIEVERPEEWRVGIVALRLYILVAIEGVIYTAGGEVLEAGLKFLLIGALIQFMSRTD